MEDALASDEMKISGHGRAMARTAENLHGCIPWVVIGREPAPALTSRHLVKAFGGGMKLRFASSCVRFLVAVVALVGMCGWAPSTKGQGIATGSLSATVSDASGASVPDADVVAKNIATGQEVAGKTNSLGYVELRSLPPGG